jgi:membrane protease subunit (stomatin/prohibitin family)
MSIVNGIRRQLRSVIEWNTPEENSLFFQWSGNGDEIKNASKLIVGPGQGCIFVYQGKVQSLLEEPGVYNLQTDNIPFWTTITKALQFFESEHKTGFYFFKRTRILNQKWGTTSSIKYLDTTYGFPVGLRSYGNFSFQIDQPHQFFTQVVGHHSHYSVTDFRKVMAARMVQRLSDYLAQKHYSYIEIDAMRDEIASEMLSILSPDFTRLGFSVTDFRVEGLDFDEETQERINRIANITADATAAQAAGLSYVQLQQLEAMKDAAKNEGGGAGLGMGMGAGIGMGQMMTGMMTGSSNTSMPANPTPITPTPTPTIPPNQASTITQKLQQLKTLFEEQLISEQEYTNKKAELLKQL